MWCVHVNLDGTFRHATPRDEPIAWTLAEWRDRDWLAAMQYERSAVAARDTVEAHAT